ncbi:transmembrane protein, putative (macronuclear) [Tetrahymena thermophila SB210]|uniref:Transmembrane protein, putative n=1 Tax=Tetrahymena thermophila (strain SB210) TaxID=312017 RepID=Q236S3_TETTS|nr:transmembrane protein, putative [Tetrahymena thermophila SB210]EAR92427.2 transmembrane protein, putative [Tetrahymena thermophila SB210]|eukprot:XP_001012672.2 transmembrane protein, putative [Tetrahymena thermophila SB210]
MKMQKYQNENSNVTLEINITIGNDFKKTLTYIQGQDPVLAASLFCEQNNLKPSAVYYIQQAIEQVIQNVDSFENENEQQSQIIEGNSNDEYDPRSSDESEYQNQRSMKKSNIYNKQYSKSPIRQKTKTQIHFGSDNKIYNGTDSENSHRMYQNNSFRIQNPGINLYQKGMVHQIVKEKKMKQMQMQQEKDELKEATFQPQINYNSILLYGKQDQQQRYEKIKRKMEDKMNIIKQNTQLQEQLKCTFQPQIGVVSSRIGQFAKEHREVKEVFQHLYLDSYRRQQEKDKRQQEIIELEEQRNKEQCPFTPEISSSKIQSFNKLSSERRMLQNPQQQDQDFSQRQDFYENYDLKNQENNESFDFSKNSDAISQLSQLTEREGLLALRPKIQTPICSYPIQEPQQELMKAQPQIQTQPKVQFQKSFFNLENKFQQMRNSKEQMSSPVKKFVKPEQKQIQKKIKRSNSLNVWEDLYKQAQQQKESQKQIEFKIKQQIQKEINKQKLSLKSKEIINQQRDQIIECIFQVLDGKEKGYISPDNLCSQFLSNNLNKILNPLYEAIRLNNTMLDYSQFNKAVKSLYNSIDFNDKLVISRILQKRSQSLPNHMQQVINKQINKQIKKIFLLRKLFQNYSLINYAFLLFLQIIFKDSNFNLIKLQKNVQFDLNFFQFFLVFIFDILGDFYNFRINPA